MRDRKKVYDGIYDEPSYDVLPNHPCLARLLGFSRTKNYLERDVADPIARLLVGLVERFGVKSVLEVGCGTGRNLQVLFDFFGPGEVELCGVDLSSVAIEQAVDRGIGCFHVGSGECLPFRDGRFDLVLTVHALEQMHYLLKGACGELHRVCGVGGHGVFFEPFFHMQTHLGKWHNLSYEYARGTEFYLKDAGFRLVGEELVGTGWFDLNRTGLMVMEKEVVE